MTGAARTSAPRGEGTEARDGAREPWCRNLLHNFEEIREHLGATERSLLEGGAPVEALLLDAVLGACALSQILDDYLHRGFFGLGAKLDIAASRPRKLEKFLEFLPGRVARPLGAVLRSGAARIPARIVDGAASWRVRLRAATRERDLLRSSARLHAAAGELARLHARAGGAGKEEGRALAREGARIAAGVGSIAASSPPRLRERVLKIPSCFKDFDCHPDDLAELGRDFARAHPDRRTPLTVVGIRTSGSYLAPLLAARLRLEGFEDVAVASIRQKVPLLRPETMRLRRRAQRGGKLLLVDDPPVTGNALLKVVRELEGIGVAHQAIVPLVLEDPAAPLFRGDGEGGSARLDELRRGGAIFLPKERWRIRALLGGDRVPGLEGMRPRPLGGGDEGGAGGGGDGGYRESRCHEKARLIPEGEAAQRGGGMFLKGCGFGWYEEHAREAARALAGLVPDCSFPAEGLLAAPWIPGERLEGAPGADEAFVRHAARYVAERARRLALRSGGGAPADLLDRETGWHVLAQSFAQSYSFLAPLAYRPLRERLSRAAARAPRAAIDGKMGPPEWIRPGGRGEGDGRPDALPLKLDFEEHAFDRMDLAILDPVYDLAGFAVEWDLPHALEARLLEEYVEASGDRGAPGRFPVLALLAGICKQAELRLLLAHGGSITRGFEGGFDPKEAAAARAAVERRLSAVANAFLASSLGADAPPPHGPLERVFALDLDGVLEDGTLGFNSTTPAGALAVRTLKRHGIAPVIASGRSLEEVRERCRAYRLAGGVAEYGSVVWIAGSGEAIQLVPDRERAQLRRLREILAGTPDVVVDPAYRSSVRAFRMRGGSRRAVKRGRMDTILGGEGLDRLRVVPGDAQLDVVGASCDKGGGLRALAERLGAREIHAAGDTLEDVAMFRAADRAYAPANVRADARRAMGRGGLYVARRKLQRGLLEIARVASHAGGGGAGGAGGGRRRPCPVCRPPEPARAAVDPGLLEAFGIRDRSRLRKILGLLRPGALHHFRSSQ